MAAVAVRASVLLTQAALNIPDQKFTGSLVSPTGSGATFTGGRASQWALTPSEFSISDPNGTVRAEMGNLAANGISPAQWGFRANDGGGSPIFDSEGLIAVMKVVASVQSQSYISATLSGPGSGTGISGTGGEVTIATTGSFTLARQTSVLLMGTVAAAGWTTTGIVPLIAPIYIRVPGQANSASGAVAHSGTAGSTTAPTSVTPIQVLTLPAGTYTASLLWNSVSGNERLDVYAYNLFVFLMGS